MLAVHEPLVARLYNRGEEAAANDRGAIHVESLAAALEDVNTRLPTGRRKNSSLTASDLS